MRNYEIEADENMEKRLNDVLKELKNIMIELGQEDIEVSGTLEVSGHIIKQTLTCTLEKVDENE